MEVVSGLVFLVLALGVIAVVLLLCREVSCWYLKINEGLELLREISREIREIRNPLPEAPVGRWTADRSSQSSPDDGLEKLSREELDKMASEMGLKIGYITSGERIIEMIRERRNINPWGNRPCPHCGEDIFNNDFKCPHCDKEVQDLTKK